MTRFSPDLEHKPLVGVTENVSRLGLLVRLRVNGNVGELPRLGEEIMADLELPAGVTARRRSLRCEGRVVWRRRVEGGDYKLGLRIVHMQFCELPVELLREDFASVEAGQVVM